MPTVTSVALLLVAKTKTGDGEARHRQGLPDIARRCINTHFAPSYIALNGTLRRGLAAADIARQHVIQRPTHFVTSALELEFRAPCDLVTCDEASTGPGPRHRSAQEGGGGRGGGRQPARAAAVGAGWRRRGRRGRAVIEDKHSTDVGISSTSAITLVSLLPASLAPISNQCLFLTTLLRGGHGWRPR